MDKFSFETLESTQITALKFASERFLLKNLKPFYVSADEQKSGIGTRSKQWHSPIGNLYVTFGFFSDKPIIAGFSLLIGLWIKENFQHFISNLPIKLKWVNDIFLNDKKLGGILINQEMIGGQYSIRMGIGLNLTESPKLQTAYQSISLYDAGYHLDKNLFLERLSQSFEEKIPHLIEGDFSKYKNQWLENALFLNQQIKFQTETKQVTGIFKDISSNGFIGIETSSEMNYYASGQIIMT